MDRLHSTLCGSQSMYAIHWPWTNYLYKPFIPWGRTSLYPIAYAPFLLFTPPTHSIPSPSLGPFRWSEMLSASLMRLKRLPASGTFGLQLARHLRSDNPSSLVAAPLISRGNARRLDSRCPPPPPRFPLLVKPKHTRSAGEEGWGEPPRAWRSKRHQTK